MQFALLLLWKERTEKMHQPPPLTLNSSIFSGPKENYRQKVVPLKPRISHELANEILENFFGDFAKKCKCHNADKTTKKSNFSMSSKKICNNLTPNLIYV